LILIAHGSLTMAQRASGPQARVVRPKLLVFCALVACTASSSARADGPVAIHSPSELVGGVVLTTLGAPSLLAGSVLLVTGAAFDCGFICVIDRSTAFAVGVPLLIGGVLFTGGGVWLALDGGRRARPTWSLAPAITPRSASLTLAAHF